MTDQDRSPGGYRGALPPRHDELARPWVVLVIVIFVLMFVLALGGVPSRFFPESTPTPLPLPSASAAASASVEASPSVAASASVEASASVAASASVEASASAAASASVEASAAP